MTKKSLIFILIILILVLAGGAYWYFFLMTPSQSASINSIVSSGGGGFQPLNRNVSSSTSAISTQNIASSSQQTTAAQPNAPLPTLRELSATPVGGYGSEISGTTTIVRWVDRGRGNIYEVDEDSPAVTTLSNTIVPRIYESLWNAKLTAFIGSLLQDDSSPPTTVYAALTPQATSTGSLTPFALHGSDIPGTLIGFALSPDKSKVFMLMDENGDGVGYVSAFDGSGMTRIFTNPLTQVNVDWPVANEIAITTKGSAQYGGFLYFVNPKTGAWKKILGPLAGLSATVSHDGTYALISVTGDNDDVLTYIYDITTQSIADAGIRTLADKCAWGNFYTDVVYCAAPSEPVAGTYPDDWYTGALSTVDEIWQVDAGTGEVALISSIIDQTNHVIDGFNLGLDAKDNYLFFMNKNDLSLWSLDLVRSR